MTKRCGNSSTSISAASAIRDELVHTTAQGKRMLVLHGDRFDGVIACAKWLAYVGDSSIR